MAMLDIEQFCIWCKSLGIEPETQKLIQKIRANPPARAVYGGRKNVTGRYPSKKMGVTIQFESHRVELARIYQLEYNSEILEYYDQPYGGVELIYESAKGRRIRQVATPDFFVIAADGCRWEECKPEVELEKLAETHPNRYCRDKDGNWRCPPGEDYASRFGLSFKVWSDAEVSWEFQDNMQWLEDYLRFEVPEIDPAVIYAVQTLVEDQRGISLAELLESDIGVTPDTLYTLIATQQIYVDLYKARLSDPHRVQVFLSHAIASAYSQSATIQATQTPDGFEQIQISIGTRLQWDGQVWEIINTGSENTALQCFDGSLVSIGNAQFDSLLRQGTITAYQQPNDCKEKEQQQFISQVLQQSKPRDLEKAQKRYEAIQPYLDSSITCPTKTLKRWRDRYLAAEKQYGNGFIGLIPEHRSQGNSVPRISPEVKEYMASYIQKHYETTKQRSVNSVFKSFKNQLAEDHPDWPHPSRVAFYAAIKQRATPHQTRLRQGKRAAIQKEPIYWELTLKTPRHGSRPFEIAHIDHTPMSVELCCSLESLSLCNLRVDKLSKPKDLTNRAWLTLMIDSYSRKILAAYITYEAPSYRSCMMAMRICVSRFKQLPRTIMVDNGSEFHSNYFSQLAAYYQITLKYRPPAYARFGTLIERMLGVTEEEFLNNLQGNTQGRKYRQTTKAVDPKRNALWNLPDLYESLCTWLYKIYDNRRHPTLDQSPNDAYVSGLAIGGQREHTRVEYDDTFKILTLAAPSPGTRTVQPSRGIKIANIWYWNDIFRNPNLEKQKVEVKYDSFNIGIAYVYANNQWVQCTSSFFSIFNGRTEKEIQLASEEIKQRKKLLGKNSEVSDRELAQFLKDVEMHEVLLKQRLKALDNQTVLKMIDRDFSESFLSTQVNKFPQLPAQVKKLSQSDESLNNQLDYLVTDIAEKEEPDTSSIEVNAEEEFEWYGEY